MDTGIHNSMCTCAIIVLRTCMNSGCVLKCRNTPTTISNCKSLYLSLITSFTSSYPELRTPTSMKSTKVQTLGTRKAYARMSRYAHAHKYNCTCVKKWLWQYDGGGAGSPQQSCFRENPTNFFTFVAR